MTYLGLKDRRNFYVKYMRPLLESGELQMTIPDKPNTKNQKYIAKKLLQSLMMRKKKNLWHGMVIED